MAKEDDSFPFQTRSLFRGHSLVFGSVLDFGGVSVAKDKFSQRKKNGQNCCRFLRVWIQGDVFVFFGGVLMGVFLVALQVLGRYFL